MSKHYRSAEERVIKAEPGSTSYSLNPQQEVFLFCCCFTKQVNSTIRIARWKPFLCSLHMHVNGLFISFRDQHLGELCHLGFLSSEWVVMLLCPHGNLEMREVGRRASTVAGWVSLAAEIREREFYGFFGFLGFCCCFEESTVELFMYFVIIYKLIIKPSGT